MGQHQLEHIGSKLNKTELLEIINRHHPKKCVHKATGRYIQTFYKEELDYILTTYFKDVLKKYWVGSYVRSETHKDRDVFHPYLKRRVRKILIDDGWTDKGTYWKKTIFQ
jgi:uncharacterized protein (DUF2249 family)